MGLLGTMSAVGTALGPTLGGVLISRTRLDGDLPRRTCRSGSLDAFCSPTATCRQAPHGRRSDRLAWTCVGTLLAGSDPCGLCTRHDDRARQLRRAQCGAAAGWRVLPSVCLCRWRRGQRRPDPAGDVPQSGAERGPCNQRARADGGDGDARGRAVLSSARARARPGHRRARHVEWPDLLGAQRHPGRPHCRSLGASFISIVGLFAMAAVRSPSRCCRRRSALRATLPPSRRWPRAISCSRPPTTRPS